MHPLLDRPHPDCGKEISELKACHADNWKKFTGQCNDIKVALDNCFRAEKKKKIHESSKSAKLYRSIEEECLKEALGQTLTFTEYLQKEREARKSESE
jgi:COX assembly mitochondrial protein 2